MKKYLLPVALMMMSSAYAQTCIESICTGDIVINTNDSVGSVVGVVDNKLIYRVGSYEYRALPSELSKEASDENFTKGKLVINSNDNIGTVLYTFADKRVQYAISGYKYVSKGLAYAVPSYGDLTGGTEVMNTNESIGTVVQTFSDGRVQYSISGYKYVTTATNLSKAIEAIDALKAGTTVINTNDNIGTVTKIFKNAKVQYSISGYKYIAPSSNLSPAVTEVDKITAGATVINTNDSIGTVAQLFANGKIQYSLSGYKYVTDSKNLSLENSGLGTVKTGSITLTSNDSVATVVKTFDNNKVQAAVSGGYKYVFDLNSLSPEVESHPVYNKENAYANGRTIGKVAYFFANEKVALKTETGSLSVTKNLSPEVPSLGRVSEGNTVVTSYGSDVKVLRLFENNTIEIEEKAEVNGEQVTKKRGITLIPSAAEMTDNLAASYAYDIYRKVEGEKVFYFASLLEEVAPIKKRIADNIKEIKKQFYMEKKSYKKFLEEVGATDDSIKDDDSDSSGPVSDDTFYVKMNTTDLKDIVVKELQKRKVSYKFSEKAEGEKQINITIERDRKVPFTKCLVKVELVVRKPNMSMTMSSGRKKSVLGWGKNSCKSVVKSALRDVI